MTKFRDLDLKNLRELAENLAQELENRPATVGLIGPLGVGKTTFIKAFAKHFGIRHITSPTFVISHEYRIGQGRLYHLDFYRLTNTKQLALLGISEMMTGKNIVLIEWADRFLKVRKKCDILINLSLKPDNKRDVTITTK